MKKGYNPKDEAVRQFIRNGKAQKTEVDGLSANNKAATGAAYNCSSTF
jgi:hypothetical protein